MHPISLHSSYCNFSQHCFLLSRFSHFPIHYVSFVAGIWKRSTSTRIFLRFLYYYFFRAVNSPKRGINDGFTDFCFYFWPPKSSQAFLFLPFVVTHSLPHFSPASAVFVSVCLIISVRKKRKFRLGFLSFSPLVSTFHLWFQP